MQLVGHRRVLRFGSARSAALFGLLRVGILPPLLGGIAAMLVTQLGGAPTASPRAETGSSRTC
jgi:hypothetical protein